MIDIKTVCRKPYAGGLGNTIYTYNTGGNLFTGTDAKSNQIAAGNKGKPFRFKYEENGNLTAKWYPNREPERRRYDTGNQLSGPLPKDKKSKNVCFYT